MKLKLHSWYLNILMSLPFWESVENQVPALLEARFPDAVKEVQLYDDYGLRTHAYAFVDGQDCYYPLSVLMKKKYAAKYGGCRIVWLQWKKDDLKGGYDKDNPFATVEQIPLSLAQNPPTAFVDAMANKAAVYYTASPEKLRCSLKTRAPGEWGNVAQSFLDVFGAQISKCLRELVPHHRLTNRWELRTCVYQETVEQNGWRYRYVDLLNPHAEALTFSVKWQEAVDMTDDISPDDIHVIIDEDGVLSNTESIAQLKRFLANGTYVFSDSLNTAIESSLQRQCRCAVTFDASFPDVTCELRFSKRPALTEIADVFAAFVKTYNRFHAPIHYVGEPIADGSAVQVHIDFGQADSAALEALAKAIGKAKWPLENVSFY